MHLVSTTYAFVALCYVLCRAALLRCYVIDFDEVALTLVRSFVWKVGRSCAVGVALLRC